MTENESSRYARDWNRYSEYWGTHYAGSYRHLGDEWHNRDFEERFFALFVARFLSESTTVLEIGPGGGKWTVQYAPLVERAVVLDVSEQMLDRTRRRCEEAGITNVEYVLGNGSDLVAIEDASIDFVFSFDVFVHVALEETWAYARDIARVMKVGGQAVLHHAVNTAPDAWDKIAKENEWYRGGAHTLGQFYYHGQVSLHRMYERVGLHLSEQYQRFEHCVNVLDKPSGVVPTLERLLASAVECPVEATDRRDTLVDSIAELPEALGTELRPLLQRLREAKGTQDSADVARLIRRLWRGL